MTNRAAIALAVPQPPTLVPVGRGAGPVAAGR